MQAFLNFFSEMASCALIAMFVENTIFTRALGTSSVLLMLRKKFNLFLFGLILTIITLLSSIGVAFVQPYLNTLEYTTYLMPLAYVLVIGLVYVITLLFCAAFLKKQMPQIRPMIHMSAFNCAVLGALLLSNTNNVAQLKTVAGVIGFGLGSGIGFTLAAYLILLGHDRLNSPKIPKAFRGFPITLIYIGILSLAFYGLIGHELPF